MTKPTRKKPYVEREKNERPISPKNQVIETTCLK